MTDEIQLIHAKTSFKIATNELMHAVKALKNTGGDFNNTIGQIKEVIGDLHMAISSIEGYEKESSQAAPQAQLTQIQRND